MFLCVRFKVLRTLWRQHLRIQNLPLEACGVEGLFSSADPPLKLLTVAECVAEAAAPALAAKAAPLVLEAKAIPAVAAAKAVDVLAVLPKAVCKAVSRKASSKAVSKKAVLPSKKVFLPSKKVVLGGFG